MANSFISSRPVDFITSRGFLMVIRHTGRVELQKGAFGLTFSSILKAYLWVKEQKEVGK